MKTIFTTDRGVFTISITANRIDVNGETAWENPTGGNNTSIRGRAWEMIPVIAALSGSPVEFEERENPYDDFDALYAFLGDEFESAYAPKKEKKHTTGPWTVHDCKDGKYSIVHNGPLAYVGNVGGENGDAIAQANARLIAASPELLDACIAIAALADGQGRMNLMEVAGQARAAIHKASR